MNTTDHETPHGSMQSYVIGFIASIVLTLAAYSLVVYTSLSTTIIIVLIMVLAVIQLVVQLVFFLHLGRESRPRWNLLAFAFMTIILLIIVIGSLWIMDNLHYNMMSPQETERHLLEKERFAE